MTGKTKRAPLTLTATHRSMLAELARSRTAPVREAERAKVLLKYADGASITDIRRDVGVSRPTIYKCIDKAVAAGVLVGLKDRFHRPKDAEITPEAKAWVVSLACTKPKDHGLAAELWTLSELAKFVGNRALESGFPRLRDTNKTTVWRILNERDIKPHRIRYYLERRDADFERQMHEVLMVYRELSLHAHAPTPVSAKTAAPVYSVSVDEKPGVQALGVTAPICRPCRASTPRSGATTSTCVTARVHPVALDRTTVKPSTTSSLVTVAGSSSRREAPRCPLPRADDRMGFDTIPPISARDHGLLGHASRSLRVRSYAQTRFLAQLSRVRFLQNGAQFSTAYSGFVQRRTETTNPQGDRRNERAARRLPVEALRLGVGMMCKHIYVTKY